jgi:hypothetical protein
MLTPRQQHLGENVVRTIAMDGTYFPNCTFCPRDVRVSGNNN